MTHVKYCKNIAQASMPAAAGTSSIGKTIAQASMPAAAGTEIIVITVLQASHPVWGFKILKG